MSVWWCCWGGMMMACFAVQFPALLGPLFFFCWPRAQGSGQHARICRTSFVFVCVCWIREIKRKREGANNKRCEQSQHIPHCCCCRCCLGHMLWRPSCFIHSLLSAQIAFSLSLLLSLSLSLARSRKSPCDSSTKAA